jgi:hypothetical protein
VLHIQASPMNWNDLPHINETPNIDETDESCLAELESVLRKHGKASRFGVSLLHSHFPLADDEVLLEHCDEEARTLSAHAVKFEKIVAGRFRPTLWRFDGRKNHVCGWCPTDENQNHTNSPVNC